MLLSASYCFASTVRSIAVDTFIPPFALFRESHHLNLSVHSTFAFFTSSDLALHACLTPTISSKTCLYPFYLPHPTRTLFSHRLFVKFFALHWYAPRVEITSKPAVPLHTLPILSHNSVLHLFIPHSIRPGHSSHTPYVLHFHNTKFVFSSSLVLLSSRHRWHLYSSIQLFIPSSHSWHYTSSYIYS